MIAEKPSIAKSISEALSNGKIKDGRRGKGKTLINFDGYFGDVKAKFTVSSVMGHVYTSDFEQKHNQWSSIDAFDLYDVPVVKLEANRKTRIPQTLQSLAKGKDILCLWLDCDKEGENICFEVINNCYKYMNKKNYQQIFRAKFSSLTKQDLKKAFDNMQERPNKFESLSVDVRQVIDLKIGVTFTRFLTSSILPGLKDEETKLLSYGPCQTPTLWFCVNRKKEIMSFVPKEYFKVYVDIEIKKIKKRIYFQNSFWDRKTSNEFLRKFDDTKTGIVSDVQILKKSKVSPCGMNTVQMLRLASSFLKISPHHTMVIAEKLYTMGYITYPRTETTKYAASFDFKKSVMDFSKHPTFGPLVNTHILKNYQR
jgi:DNA topoisomerase-3